MPQHQWNGSLCKEKKIKEDISFKISSATLPEYVFDNSDHIE